MPVSDAKQHGVFRHDRFTASHFSLKQPIHWVRLAHVRCNLANGFLLRPCQLKGKETENSGIDPGIGGERGRAPLMDQLPPPPGQSQLHNQQLLVNKPPLSKRQAGAISGCVYIDYRPADGQQLMTAQVIVRKNLFYILDKLFDNCLHNAADLPLAEPFGKGIHGEHSTCRWLLFCCQVGYGGVNHLPAKTAKFRLAGEDDALPLDKSIGQIRLVEPDST
jgi:hypothetical protein